MQIAASTVLPLLVYVLPITVLGLWYLVHVEWPLSHPAVAQKLIFSLQHACGAYEVPFNSLLSHTGINLLCIDELQPMWIVLWYYWIQLYSSDPIQHRIFLSVVKCCWSVKLCEVYIVEWFLWTIEHTNSSLENSKQRFAQCLPDGAHDGQNVA